MKVCSQCGIKKPLSEFYKDKNSKIGVQSYCKVCAGIMQKRYRQNNKDKVNSLNRNWREKNKEKCILQQRKRREENKEEINRKERERRNTPEGKKRMKEREKLRREKHRDKINERTRRWHEKNKEHVRNRKIQKRLENPEYAKELRLNSYARTRGFKNYAELLIDRENRKLKTKDSIKNFEKRQFHDIIEFKDEWKELCKTFKKEYDREKYKEKRINDIQYKLSVNMRARVRKALKNQSAKKTKSTMDLVGCTGLELSYYLNNLGYDKDTDHIDHIVPISRFNLTDPEHQLVACHYLNLQPLHYIDNCSKHDSLPENWQDVIIRICEVRNINPQSIIKYIGKTVLC
jgi:hypothetical protein